MGNSIGTLLKLTTFGESHGTCIGGVLDGFPSGIEIDFDLIKSFVDRRKPGFNAFETERIENDQVNFLSGIFESKTTGAPVSFIVNNDAQRSSDYKDLKDVYRPSHGDYTWYAKYGHSDYRGGGRLSARETVARVVAGALAFHLLKPYSISIIPFVSQIGSISTNVDLGLIKKEDLSLSPLQCPDSEASLRMLDYLNTLKKNGDTCGGIITCVVRNVPAGLGDPVYNKMSASLASAMMSIPSVNGFELGHGFQAVTMKGSEHNDEFFVDGGNVKTSTNHSGGIQGGITNAQNIVFRVSFKPISSIKTAQKTVTRTLEEKKITIKGRHDVCVVPRAAVIVEAMTALVLADHLLINQTVRYK